jgi:DNA repair exonuclease SbcCD ATPase subunit
MTPNTTRQKDVEAFRRKLAVIDTMTGALRNYLAFDIEDTLQRIEEESPEFDRREREELFEQLQRASETVQQLEVQRDALLKAGENPESSPMFAPMFSMLIPAIEAQLRQRKQKLTDIQRELEEMENPTA